MRLYEFFHGPTNTPESNLLTALELLRNRYKDTDTPPKIHTRALINLVLNTDRSFDYNALVSANENNPAVKNLIKSFNRDYVELQPFGDEKDEEDTNDTNDNKGTMGQPISNLGLDSSTVQQPVDTVKDMASRAAFNRGAPMTY